MYAPSAPQQNVDKLANFVATHEINSKYVPWLSLLVNYRSILIFDDSGSMIEAADPDVSNVSRWEELKTYAKIVMDAHTALNITCDVYFINRGFQLDVNRWNEIEHLFQRCPAGFTNIEGALNFIYGKQLNADMGKPIIIHLFTDGHPTNDTGAVNVLGLNNAIKNRPFKNKCLFSVVLCTDDEMVKRSYSNLECRNDTSVDISEDYRGELRLVKRQRGSYYRFTQGDYIVKILVGTFDKSIHQVDMPESCCLVC